MKREQSFFVNYMVLMLFFAGASLIFSYIIYPTKEWLILYDPLQLAFFGLKVDHPSVIGFGALLEFVRMIIALGMFYVLFMTVPYESLRKLKSVFPEEVIDTSGVALKGTPTELKAIPSFLWGDYPLIPIAAFLSVLVATLFFGPRVLNQDLSETCFPRQPIISLFIKSTIPIQLQELNTASKTPACAGYLGKDAYYKAGEKTELWNKPTTSNSLVPYAFYSIYSLIIYIFIILVIIVHLWSLFYIFDKNVKNIIEYITRQSEDTFSTYEKYKEHLLKILRDFMNPIGWSLFLVMILMFYEVTIASVAQSDTGRALTLITAFVWILGILSPSLIILNSVDNLSTSFLEQSRREKDPELVDKLIRASNEIRPETILANRKMSFIWRLIGHAIQISTYLARKYIGGITQK